MTAIAATTTVAEVTLLEDRAQVRRRGRAVIAAGTSRVVVDGVSPILVDKSILVSATNARVTSASCERYWAPWADPASLEEAGGSAASVAVVDLERARKQLQARINDDQRAAVIAEGEAAAVIDLAKAAMAELADAAAWGEAPEAGTGAAKRLADLDARERAARGRAAALAIELDARRADLARLETRLAAARSSAGKEAARIVIELAADAAADIDLGVEYVVPGAAWRPYHRAQLDPATGALAWRTDATVWQATGEDWTNAALTFSTERPSLGVEPPELVDDILRVRKRPDQVVVETRDQEIDDIGLGRGGKDAEDVPGIDDGGLGTRLRAPSPATIPSDGRPYRVLLAERAMRGDIALVAMPERGLAAHVRVVATNPGPAPILAGPVDLVLASGYAGRAVIGFVAADEQLEIGFGPDAELRFHREEDRVREEGGLLSGWNDMRVRVAVRVSNLGAAAKSVRVTERVPISEVEQVRVELSPPDAWRLEDDAGRRENIPLVVARTVDDHNMVTWNVELGPRERKAVALEYRVRSQKGVVGV